MWRKLPRRRYAVPGLGMMVFYKATLKDEFMSAHNFRITLEYAGGKKAAEPPEPLSFEAGNHDDIFDIIARVRGSGLFDQDEAAALALGMKLFSEVMLAHRDDPLFAPIAGAYRDYMVNFKARMREANAPN